MMESTCIYLIENGRWLMMYRNRKPDDINEGKWIGVGGKSLPGETPLECAVREFREETGMEPEDMELAGTVDFCYDTRETERIHVFLCYGAEGELRECGEGTFAWIEENKILELPLWEGDKLFLRKMIDREGIPFHMTLFYDDKGNLLKAQQE